MATNLIIISFITGLYLLSSSAQAEPFIGRAQCKQSLADYKKDYESKSSRIYVTGYYDGVRGKCFAYVDNSSDPSMVMKRIDDAFTGVTMAISFRQPDLNKFEGKIKDSTYSRSLLNKACIVGDCGKRDYDEVEEYIAKVKALGSID
jgi:hypothetical protein